MRYKLLSIEGNIGSGKTTLAKKMTADLNAKLILEEFADNPFLPKFYKSPEQYAFPLELYFMAERYQQLKNEWTRQDLFSDLTITDYMFTKSLLFAKVTLEDDEFRLYQRLFDIINPTLPSPELIIYLYATTDKLMENIQLRGRSYEQNIQKDYLLRIQKTYLDYFNQSPGLTVLILDVNRLDLIGNDDTYQWFKEQLEKEYPYGIHYLKQ